VTEAWIGIDQSYSGFGLCVLRERDHTTTVAAFPSSMYGSGIDRLNAIGQWLQEQIGKAATTYNVTHVCMEGYSYGSAYNREDAGELGAVVKTVLRYRLDSPVCYPTIVSPPALKKFVSGSGRAGKDLVLTSVHHIWGVDYTAEFNKTQADNAADAYVLARIAKAMAGCSHEPRDLRIAGIVEAHTEMVRKARVTPRAKRPVPSV
jgi:Holliday junction resolvasome RuvABC endonuclease subunit